jgi:hypothetical protein
MQAQNNPAHSKRGPSSFMILGACLLGAAVALFGLNIYHANECRPKSPDELEQYIESINRRLLQAESQVKFLSFNFIMRFFFYSNNLFINTYVTEY